MDYIKIPRSLIYKERTELKEFGVQVIETVNQQLFLNLKDLFMATDRAKELILRCFNNAYYICTIIPFEDFPETQVAEYENLLMKGETYDLEEVCAVSMAMVCKLLQAHDARWRQEGNDLIKNIIYRFTHYRWYHSGPANSFLRMLEKQNTNGLFLTRDIFAPRDIIEPIENESVGTLDIYKEYICERLTLIDDQRRRLYGADLAIARLNDDLKDIYENYGYDYATYTPKPEDFGTPNDLWAEDYEMGCHVKEMVDGRKTAIEFYSKYYQRIKEGVPQQMAQMNEQPEALKNSSEIADLHKRIQVLTKDNNRLQSELSKFKSKMEEYRQPVEELTAEQKVRMAFALQLLKAAGLTDEKLNQNKSKVATVIHLLTGIGANNNGNYPPTQICQNWLVDKLYYPERNTETLVELNTLCAQLGIEKAFLKLGPQSND